MFNSVRKFNAKRVRKSSVVSRDLRISASYVPSSIDSFLIYKHENAHASDSIRVTSDLYMLFNQQRLDRQTRTALIQYFDDMQVREPALASLRAKLSDDQLISFVKSRYIQSQSELLGWSRYLNAVADDQLREIMSKLQTDPVDPTDPNPADPTDPKPADPAPAPVQ